jgi:hypothetical protein
MGTNGNRKDWYVPQIHKFFDIFSIVPQQLQFSISGPNHRIFIAPEKSIEHHRPFEALPLSLLTVFLPSFYAGYYAQMA